MNENNRMRVCFFVGPSVPPEEFRAAVTAIDAEVLVLPPVQQGDLIRLYTQLPDVIGIIDGYFFQVPAVYHKEILFAIEQGARVLGASSLGALRAAELDVFGMEGIGEIYRMYKRGIIDADDEVALLHTDEENDYRPMSVPLVDIRYNLRRAYKRRIISSRTATAVLAIAKELSFQQRNYPVILTEARRCSIPQDELTALQTFLDREAMSLKCEDALALVRAVAARTNGTQPWLPRIPLQVHQTTYFVYFQREYIGHSVNGHYVPDILVLAFQKLLSPSFPRIFRRLSLRCMALEEAAHRGIEFSDSETLIQCFRHWQNLPSDEARQQWLRDHYMSYEELLKTLRERDLEARLLTFYHSLYPGDHSRAAVYRRIMANIVARTGVPEAVLTRPLLMRPIMPWEGPLLRELKMRGRFRVALELAARILQVNANFSKRYPDIIARLSPSGLNHRFAVRWGISEAELPSVLFERGFTDQDEFIETARLACVYDGLIAFQKRSALQLSN